MEEGKRFTQLAMLPSFTNIRETKAHLLRGAFGASKPFNPQIYLVIKEAGGHLLPLPHWELIPPTIYLGLYVTCIVTQTANSSEDSDLGQ